MQRLFERLSDYYLVRADTRVKDEQMSSRVNVNKKVVVRVSEPGKKSIR